MTVTQIKVSDFVFISYRSAQIIAKKYGISRMSKTAVQYLNLFLDEMVCVMVKASSDYRLDHIKLPAILRRLCPHGSLAVNAIADGENFLSQASLKSDPKEFSQGQLPLATIVEGIRAQCSIYSTMGSSCVYISKDRWLITSRTAALLCGILEHVATFLIVDTILLARNHQLLYVDSKIFESAIEANKELRGVYNKTNLANSMEGKRAERFGLKCERSAASSLDSEEADSLSDFDCDGDDLSLRSSDESHQRRDRGAFAKIFGGFRPNRPKGISIPCSFVSPRSSIEDFLFNGRQSPKAIFCKSPESRNSTLSLQLIEQTRVNFPSSSLINQEKARSFEALVNSTETLKISLTSSRLQTIEIKNPNRPRLVPRDESDFYSRGSLAQMLREIEGP